MELTFNYDGSEINYLLKNFRENFNDILGKCRNDIDKNSITFLYNGKQIDANISVNKIINNNDIERKKMNILIIDKKEELKDNLI